MAKNQTNADKPKTKVKRYATRYGQHYSIVMIPTVTEVINGIAVTRPGKTIEFKSGIYETKDQSEQDFLDNSPFVGVDYQEVTKEISSALSAKSLSEKEAELSAKEEELKAREMALKGKGEKSNAQTVGAEEGSATGKKKEPKF
jgi:hypothetical protein